MTTRKRNVAIGAVAVAVAVVTAACATQRALRIEEPVTLVEDAGWCWFQDERAIALDADTIAFGSVANGSRDAARRGDIQITQWNTADGSCSTLELEDRLERDDHDVPALWMRDDGRVLATWTTHGKDEVLRSCVSTKPRDVRAFEPMRKSAIPVRNGHGVTYSNLHRLGDALVCVSRADGWNPTVLVAADDDASKWQSRGRLLAGPGRPYLKFASAGGKLHFVATEQHPRDFDNSLWHGVTDATGDVCASTGEAVGAWGMVAPQQCTRVFEGTADAVAWPCDLELDAQQRPVALFSVQKDGRGKPRGQGGLDHRYCYARFDGEAWRVREIAFAGSKLYSGEDDYTGLACVWPDDPSVVFVSCDVDPRTGEALVSKRDGERHWEIFMGVTDDLGATFTWTAITRDSLCDNLRPIAPRWRTDRCALLWLRGELRTYTDYTLDAVGLVVEPRR